jgi:hypothetical protein
MISSGWIEGCFLEDEVLARLAVTKPWTSEKCHLQETWAG